MLGTVEVDRWRRRVVAAPPGVHLLGTVTFGGLLLVEALERAVVAFVEPPVAIPAGATGVLLNVTSVGSTASGFISIRPGDATGSPSTSSLNVTAGVIVPNSVQVSMPTAGANAGRIDITWDAFGVAGPTTDILIDVVGYTTNTGLQELVADLYTKDQLGAGYVTSSGAVSQAGSVLQFSGSEQTVATLDLPAGKYVVNASVMVNNNDNAVRSVGCELELGGVIIDSL